MSTHSPEGISTRKFDAVILDMDGVITRTADVHSRAWKQMFDEYFNQHNISPLMDQEEDYPAYLDGKPRYKGVNSFLKARQIDLPWGSPEDPPGEETVCGLGNRKNVIFNELLDSLKPGVYEDTIAQIHAWREAGLKTAVVTSSKNGDKVLKSANVQHLFDFQLDGEVSVKRNLKGKPDPDIFLEAARELGTSPERSVVIEDAISGVQAGRAGNFKLVVGVDRDHQSEKLASNGADIVVKSLNEIPLETNPPQSPQSAGLTSALVYQQKILARTHDRDPWFFLDYDGTLSPIVDDPDKAVISEELRETLRELSRICKVSVVSGRDRADVKEKVGLDNLVYAGSHGFDITGPNDLNQQHEKGQQLMPVLEKAHKTLQEVLADIPGAHVERKKYAVAVHYRRVQNTGHVNTLKQKVEEVARQFSELKQSPGKKIIELKPALDWHKGKAVRWLLQTLGDKNTRYLPIYIGDDTTDEDAFKELGDEGVGIMVGGHGQQTAANWALDSVEDVQRFLHQFTHALKTRKNDR